MNKIELIKETVNGRIKSLNHYKKFVFKIHWLGSFPSIPESPKDPKIEAINKQIDSEIFFLNTILLIIESSSSIEELLDYEIQNSNVEVKNFS